MLSFATRAKFLLCAFFVCDEFDSSSEFVPLGMQGGCPVRDAGDQPDEAVHGRQQRDGHPAGVRHPAASGHLRPHAAVPVQHRRYAERLMSV